VVKDIIKHYFKILKFIQIGVIPPEN